MRGQTNKHTNKLKNILNPNIINNYISNCETKRWTHAAIECYKNGCICSKCNLKMETKCGMKKTVLELVRTLGRPMNI